MITPICVRGVIRSRVAGLIKQTIRHFGLLLLISLMATATPAETDLTGEIGIDLASLSYKTDIKDTAWDYSASRRGSRHFVNLNLLGPIVNDHFANYTASMRLYGSYFRSTAGHESRTDYIQPDLKGFYGQATFLPPIQSESRARDQKSSLTPFPCDSTPLTLFP